MPDAAALDKQVDALLAAGDRAGAVRALYEGILQEAQDGRFAAAEALRERLMAVDDLALNEIIRSAEVIEAAKTAALDPEHLRVFDPLYQKLTEEERNALFFALTRKDCAPGEVLMRQGDLQQRLFFLDRGQLKLYFRQGEQDQLLQTLEPGAIAGQETFLSICGASAHLAALNSAQVRVLSAASLNAWNDRMPSLAAKLLDHLRRQNDIPRQIAARGVERRASRRVKLQGKASIQILEASGAPLGRPFRGDLLDISATGLALQIKATAKSARMLLGRTLQLTLSVAIGGRTHGSQCRGTVVALNQMVFGDFTLHFRFTHPPPPPLGAVLQKLALPQEPPPPEAA
jgi:CRP-like cAMP-binding protein